MLPGRAKVPRSECPGCGAALAADQGWCTSCGQRNFRVARDPRRLIANSTAPVVVPRKPGHAFGIIPGGRLELFPGIDMSLRAALLAFAVVMGAASWAGAASMRLGGFPSYLVRGGVPHAPAAPQAPSPLPNAPSPPADVPSLSGPLGLPPVDNYVPPPPPPPLKPDEGTDSKAAHLVPSLSHVWVIVMSGTGFSPTTGKSPLFDVAESKSAGAAADGGKPWFARKAVPDGVIVQNYYGTARGALADQVAIISGQATRSAHTSGCPSFTEAAVDGVDSKGLAKDTAACGFGAAVPTIFSELSATGRSSRIYSGAVDADPTLAAAACSRPALASAFPARLSAATLFEGFTQSKRCPESVASISSIATDAGAVEDTPAFSLVLPGPCNNGSPAACSPGSPAGMAPADEFLKSTLTPILASDAYKQAGAVFVVTDQTSDVDQSGKPLPADSIDNGACCGDRPWYPDQAKSGGGWLGALVMSPLVKPGTSDNAFSGDHYDLLNTISRALGVKPLGLAADRHVQGFTRSVWGKWDGRSPAAGG